MSGLGSLLNQGFKRIGRAADKLLLSADARKAISDEVRSKFKPKIDLAREAENKRAANIKELGDKLTESKANWQKAQDDWQAKYDNALADAKSQRQKDISDYETNLKGYEDAVSNAKANKKSISYQLMDQEDQYDPFKTLYTDVYTGDKYLLNRYTGSYENISQLYPTLNPKEQRALQSATNDFGERLWDSKSRTVINTFDKSANKNYGKYSEFTNYKNRVQSQYNADLRNADDQIKQADDALTNWKNNNSRPADWDETTPNNNDLINFDTNFKANNAQPTEYSFNGQNYADATKLGEAYQDALKHEKALQNSASKSASRYISDQKAEIARRIQDAKNIRKTKLALGALGIGAGAGALYAGAKAMYGSDDTDNGDTSDNKDKQQIDAYTGEFDHDFNVEKEGQDPDKAEAEAVLAGAAYDKGVEDGSSVGSSDDLGNNIGASTGGHTMEDRLYELIKAMKDPYKADAVANYIYSRHGDDPEVQRLGWRGWLNKYYGDSLRTIMNRDPSGYKGMHISGGL